MIKRRIFKQRKSKYKILFFFLISIFLIILLYFTFSNKKSKFITIPENTNIFYIIPFDKGGAKVDNLDKKSLNFKSQKIVNENINKPENLLYSIQFYTSSDFNNLSNFLNKITKYDESIYHIHDFFILALNLDIGIEYFLLYKNFKTRNDAQNYCLNFLIKLDNCVIVDTTKF